MVWLGKNRRQSSDFWVYMARILAVGSWVLFILALVISKYAAPETSFGYLRYQNIAVRNVWLQPLTGYLYIILWVCAFSSFLCLLVAKYRSRRGSDNKFFNIILLLIITVAWVTYILISVSKS